jgi:hypothetical protein
LFISALETPVYGLKFSLLSLHYFVLLAIKGVFAKFGLLVAGLLEIQFFWDITLFYSETLTNVPGTT